MGPGTRGKDESEPCQGKIEEPFSEYFFMLFCLRLESVFFFGSNMIMMKTCV